MDIERLWVPGYGVLVIVFLVWAGVGLGRGWPRSVCGYSRLERAILLALLERKGEPATAIELPAEGAELCATLEALERLRRTGHVRCSDKPRGFMELAVPKWELTDDGRERARSFISS